MFILSVFKSDEVDQEYFEMALNCSAQALVSILDDANLDVSVDEEKAQIHVKLVDGASPKNALTLEQFKQLSKSAFMESGKLYDEFHHLEAVEE